jgi:Lipid A 3-O-deacylase (PagL)
MQRNEQEKSAFKREFVPCLQTAQAVRSTRLIPTQHSLPRDGVKQANRSQLQWFRHMHPARLLGPIAFLGLFILIHAQSFAGDTTLLSIGPRYGFSRKDPLLGKRQTANFDLVDVAALFRLPWSWPLGESPWSVETGLLTSAGALSAAGDTGFIATVVPRVALSGWNGFASIDAGIGLGLFGRDKYGTQDFGGHVQLVLTTALHIHPISQAFAGFRLQHFSDAGLYGSHSLGVDLYIIEVGYRF